MRQYRRFKEQYPDCVLFFRMGDFYEMFYDDAKLANRVLGVTLTQRTEGVPMAGVPYHAVEGYLRRMIQAGHRVAVCEQMEDPAQAKGVVQRDVTRVVTPGTLTDESLLEEGRENPLAAVAFHEVGETCNRISLAWVELSTGAFHLATLASHEVADELARIAPRELLHVETADRATPKRVTALTQPIQCVTTPRPGWHFRQAEAAEILHKQFQVATLAGFGLGEDDPAIGPAGALIQYLLETQKSVTGNGVAAAKIGHLRPPQRFRRDQHLVIDQVSLRSLEVEQTMRSGATDGSVLGVLQNCATAMGKRMLRRWLCYPLSSREAIEQRQRVVAALMEDQLFLESLRAVLNEVQDVERISSRIGVGRAFPRDLVGLGRSARLAAALTDLLAQRPSVLPYYERMQAVISPLEELAQALAAACLESPPPHLREGGLIRDGYDVQLDEYRTLQRDSDTWLAGYQKQLIEESGIASLKVGYNRVFGYYIELSATQRGKAPDAWSRKQTLKNAERFITPQLKEFEGKVLSAQSRAVAREQELFVQLCLLAQRELPHLHVFCETVAALDVLTCFAHRAVRRRYVRPVIVDEPVLQITAGRHPVLDELLGDQFVPNDVDLGTARAGGDPPARHCGVSGVSGGGTLALITGPNMAGKSTYIRQTALIVLLAHTGSFVPAEHATIGLCDRIFTRVGASDELHAGQSTFMVEMTETANICNHATERSLVILDEIGRGTSTLDGLSLAWAIAEFLARSRCRCLFATHYHEITALAEQHDNVVNLNVTVREWQDQIIFLHRIVAGAADRSYGIHVAKIAGLPPDIIRRANELMAQLEVSHTPSLPAEPVHRPKRKDPQLSLFTEYLPHPVVSQLATTDLTTLSPLEAFDLLRHMQQQAKQG